MIPAPEDLYAYFRTDDSMEIAERVYAFGKDGDAMVLDQKQGKLIPVYSVPLVFLELRFVLVHTL